MHAACLAIHDRHKTHEPDWHITRDTTSSNMQQQQQQHSLVAHDPEALLGCHNTPELVTLRECRLDALRHGVFMAAT